MKKFGESAVGGGLDTDWRREDLVLLREIAREYDGLQQERDEYAVKKINEDLKEGEVGIMIWGASHKIADHLDPDIEVEDLSPRIREATREFGEGISLGEVVRVYTGQAAEAMGFEPLDDFKPTGPEGRA